MRINEKKLRLLVKCAMNYGVILGAFWVFKYLFLIASESITFGQEWYFPDLLKYFHFPLLAIVTLSLYYVLLNRYRDNALGGKMSDAQCLSFSVLLFTFAALIEAVIIYIHYEFINPKYIYSLDRDKRWFETFLYILFSREWLETQRDTYGAIIVIISEIVKNIVIGFLLSLLYGIFVHKSDTKVP